MNITKQSLQDYAVALMRQDGSNCVVAGDFEMYYKGKGNLCLQAILAFEGAGIHDRDQRLQAVYQTFDMTAVPKSFKELTVGQLRAIIAFQQDLGTFYGTSA